MSRTDTPQPEPQLAATYRKRRRMGLFALQAVLSVVLAYNALHALDWGVLAHMAARQGLVFFLVSSAVLLLTTLLYAVRWQEVLAAMGHRRSFAPLARQVFVGIFFNNFLPMGQDASRTYYLGRDTGYVAAGVSVLVDKILGLAGLTVVGAALIPALGLSSPLFAGALMASLLFALACAVVLASTRLPLERLQPFLKRWPLGRKILDFAANIRTQAGSAVNLRVLGVALAVILGSMILQALVYSWFLTTATGASPSLLHLVAALCLITTVANMPVSVNGIGVREQAHALLLVALGAPPEAAVGLSLLQYVFMLPQSIIGWSLWITRPRVARQVPVAEAEL